MKYFVLYDDGYCDNGGHGWKDFHTKEKALDYIEYRMKESEYSSLDSYTLIEGKELALKSVEVITKITTE